MKKLLWVMAALFVSFAVAAQTTDDEGRIIINSAEEFLKIGNNAGYPIDTNSSYIQTADINLGNMGTLDAAIIKVFRGTYDGGGHSISYSATFQGKKHRDEGYACNNHGDGNGSYDGDYGLFGFLIGGEEHGGVIKNLNLSGDILITPSPNSDCNNMNYALLCGHAFCRSTIDHCNVTGTLSSQVEGVKGGGDAGLLVGQADGATIQYCTGSGSVSSVGWAGGLIGSGGYNSPITIKACTFSGSVQAIRASSNKDSELVKGYGGFAGGIIGFAGKHGNIDSNTPSTVTIDLCYVDADITATNVASGIASVAMGAGTATVTNSCAEGNITKTGTGVVDTITNSSIKTSNLHNSTDKSVDVLEQIVEALNNGRTPGEKAEFDVVDGQIVLYPDGKPKAACAAVTGLTISSVTPGSLTCSWTKGGSETEWSVSISGGNLTGDITVTAMETENTDFTIANENLTTSPSNYVLSVVAKCSETSLSVPATSSFFIPCPTIAGMIVTPAYTSAKVDWTNSETVQAELYRGDTLKATETITSAKTHTFISLVPNTTYKVKLSAACGGDGDYGAPTERVFTTPSLPIVSGLTTAPSYDGTNSVGSVTISWNAYTLMLRESDCYEMKITTLSDGTTETIRTTNISYTKTQIGLGSYTVKVRVKYGDRYSGWTDEYPFVISNPNAPKNPTWTFLQNGNNYNYDVTVTWTKGNQVDVFGNVSDANYSIQHWIVETDNTVPATNALTNECSYTFTSVAPGSDLPVSIVEYLNSRTEGNTSTSNSTALSFTIPVPCFEIVGTPTPGNITQTSATLNGLSGVDTVYLSGIEEPYVIGEEETSLSLSDLTPATHYTAEVRSYCTPERYSSKTVEFTTVGCYSPTNVKITDITSTSAKVSWTQGTPTLDTLLFKCEITELIEGGNGNTDIYVEYSGTSKTFTNLKPATQYRVSIYEQCGGVDDYDGTPTVVTFTTSSSGHFVAIKTGGWGSAATWNDGRIPDGWGPITINSGVTVTLDKPLVLKGNCTLTNDGTLLINSNGELVNTTDNNNLGKVKIAFNSTKQENWSFVGVPFAQNYRLETIAPHPGSDVAVVLYDYPNGRWSSDWATIDNIVPVAEGFFLWPFYYGAIIFNNDYNNDSTVDYTLNNSDITVTRKVVNSSGGNWMALANPYPAKLNIAKFWQDNSSNLQGQDNSSNLQGNVVYKYNTEKNQFEIKDCNDTNLFVAVCEGFFVNFRSAGDNKSVVFRKTQMTSYPTASEAKSKTAQNPWIEMSLVNKRDEVKFYFVQNPLAEQGYDKYDANKLFATTGVAEPYFVTDGMNLVKEEVRELPYYATLNVRSEQDTLMTFVADKIPEGYRVSLIDGEQTIEMNEGSRYETNISAGENADRFKLLIQNNVGLNQVSQTDITITNSNRHVAISAEAISNVEVFNALGQRVYQTKASTFTLSSVPSGVYVVRVSTDKGTKSQKIVVE